MQSKIVNLQSTILNNLSLLLFLLAVPALPAAAAEPGITVERATSAQAADRERLARTLYSHDFENDRDPDTGLPLPESADYDNDGWPDFWEPVRAVGFPEYLISTVSIVTDATGQIPGNYRDVPNHVLHMGYDGTRVGVRTRTPVPIDPELSYEFSIFARDSGIRGARIRAGVDWMRIDPSAVAVLRSDEIPDLGTGQIDWPVVPAKMLVSDPPPAANAARLFVILDRLPDNFEDAYHGDVWVDDISLKPHPRIMIGAPRPSSGGDAGQIIPVRYAGLFDNVPDPANPGFFKGKRYFRRVEVTDVHNRPIGAGLRERAPVRADDGGGATEEVSFPRGRYGVYYFNIRLYDADDRLTTDVMRAVAVMRPEDKADALALRTGKPLFGVRAGVVPDAVLARPNGLGSILLRSGTRQTKIVPWRTDYAESGGNENYYAALADAMRGLRSSGITVTGVISPPPGMFGGGSLAQVMAEDGERLNRLLDEAGRRLGLFMDGWQWGDDGDASLYGMPRTNSFDAMLKTLGEYSGGQPMVENLRLGAGLPRAAFPAAPTVAQAYASDLDPVQSLWPNAAKVFPWLFEPYFLERGRIYPPERLARLAPAPAADQVEDQARSRMRSGAWLYLESAPALSHEPNAAAEKIQLEQMMKRGVYAAIVAPEVIFLGDLFDAERGMLRRDRFGDKMLETLARPSFLAAATLARHLEGADYLGELGLLPPFEAHVFRRPGTDEAVVAIWHNGSPEERPLARAEIADGPPLQLVDWAGNQTPLPRSIPVRRVPSFITGLSATLALTRMSVRVGPEPPLLSETRSQPQNIEVVNHMPRQAPIRFRLRYAARRNDGGMENGWVIRPDELRLNLPPVGQQLVASLAKYSVAPDPGSQIQIASPAGADKQGGKLAQVSMTVNSVPPADMTLYLPFRLLSHVDVDIEPLRRQDDPHFVTLLLKVRWFPPDSGRRRGDITLTPYYMKRGQTKETAPFAVTVKAQPPEDRGRPDAQFESVELRIPRNPQSKTWVGLEESGGNAFYLADVTDFMLAQ